jgi:hypothetical protein
MTNWERKVDLYERVFLKDQVLSYEEIMDDLVKLIPQPKGFLSNMGWFSVLRKGAERMAKRNLTEEEKIKVDREVIETFEEYDELFEVYKRYSKKEFDPNFIALVYEKDFSNEIFGMKAWEIMRELKKRVSKVWGFEIESQTQLFNDAWGCALWLEEKYNGK